MNDEIIYQDVVDERSVKLPLRRAASIAIHNSLGQVLVGQRNPLFVEEYKNVWSLPSVFVSDEDCDLAELVKQGVRIWFDLELQSVKLAVVRLAPRPQWRLQMHLFVTQIGIASSVSSKHEKYVDVKWVDGGCFRSSPKHELGDCTLAYLAYRERDPG